MVSHFPGKLLYAADTLSRALTSPEDDSLQDDAEMLVDTIEASLPASKAQLAVYLNSQKSDYTLILVRLYCQNGWASKHQIPHEVKPY